MSNKINSVGIWRLWKFSWAVFTRQYCLIAIIEYYHLNILTSLLFRLFFVTVLNFHLSRGDFSIYPISYCLSSRKANCVYSGEWLIALDHIRWIYFIVGDRVGCVEYICFEIFGTFDCLISETRGIRICDVRVASTVLAISIFIGGCNTVLKLFLKLRSCSGEKVSLKILYFNLEILDILTELCFQAIDWGLYFRFNLWRLFLDLDFNLILFIQQWTYHLLMIV